MSMDRIIVANEEELKKWVREAVLETLETAKPKEVLVTNVQEDLLDRFEMARKLKISLTTLNVWANEGLPRHKRKRKVYFLYSEVLEFISKKKGKKKYEWM